MKLDKLFLGLNVSSLGLSAQRKRMNAIANNMANSETTKTEEGGPYKRRVVTLATGGSDRFTSAMKNASLGLEATDGNHLSGPAFGTGGMETLPGAVLATEQNDETPFRMVYDPSHPDSDADGYVKMPNVNVVTEMVDMISASRAFEANVTAISAAKSIAKDSLEI